MNTNQNNGANDLDLGDDLVITQVDSRAKRQMAGTWVSGTIHEHRFEALVFPEHASNPEYEIGDSRISKLWLQRLADKKEVYNWDRGLDHGPADKTAAAIVDFLAAGLAEHTFGE